MKKIMLLLILMIIPSYALAVTDEEIIQEQSIQSHINDTGSRILNANKIEQRVAFVYDKTEKQSLLKIDPSLTDRQVVLYSGNYKFIQNDDELAAFLSRGILYAMKSYRGFFNGYLRRVPGPTFSLDHEFRQDPGPPGGQAHVAMRPILLLLGGLASSLHPPCGRDQRAGDVVGRPYGPGKTETRSGLRLVGKIRSGVFQCKRFVDPDRQSGQAALFA